ncbi:MAG: hypothetical protein PHH54_02540 [Candidatus Nanoarchaeia archaeon]|nr:hypothetical protein [Candidatus Nanoarchaeia archaeon]MDD5740839.1 hypothetical protein [Candidatus Nanoarchaeia archaeon]
MKWYLASRQSRKEEVKRIIKSLEEHGQEISYNWTGLESLHPYSENKDKSIKISGKIPHAISSSDIFVLFSDSGGTDMFIELGIAINNFLNHKKPKIYILGEYNSRSLMHFHHSITRVNSIEEVFEEEKLSIK